jgi:hypothetical protein
LLDRKDSAKIGVQKTPPHRFNKNIENINVGDCSKARRNSKVYADMNFFSKNAAEKQNLLLDSSELHNFLFNFREGTFKDKKLSISEPKSLSYSNKHQNKMSASTSQNSENSNNLLKIPDPLCPESSRISNCASSGFDKKNKDKCVRKHEKSQIQIQSNRKFLQKSSTNDELKNVKKYKDSNADLFLVFKKKQNYLRHNRSFNKTDKGQQLVVTNQKNAHRIYYKDENLNFL